MKVLLTGMTGNLGHEVAHALRLEGIEVIACVRPGKWHGQAGESVERDLLASETIPYEGALDAVVHAAGNVRFHDAGTSNERMILPVIALAEARGIPVYAVSTAFLYKPDPGNAYANSYEEDKARMEARLTESGIEHALLRPSVLTGSTRTGELRSYTGYYRIVRAVRDAALHAKGNGRRFRFPQMRGYSDIIPVDIAAGCVVRALTENLRGVQYITNPNPPSSDWLLEETLSRLGLREAVEVVPMTLEEFGSLSLTEEERMLHQFAESFKPYWSMEYRFPESVCTKAVIDNVYLERTLSAFSRTHG